MESNYQAHFIWIMVFMLNASYSIDAYIPTLYNMHTAVFMFWKKKGQKYVNIELCHAQWKSFDWQIVGR